MIDLARYSAKPKNGQEPDLELLERWPALSPAQRLWAEVLQRALADLQGERGGNPIATREWFAAGHWQPIVDTLGMNRAKFEVALAAVGIPTSPGELAQSWTTRLPQHSAIRRVRQLLGDGQEWQRGAITARLGLKTAGADGALKTLKERGLVESTGWGRWRMVEEKRERDAEPGGQWGDRATVEANRQAVESLAEEVLKLLEDGELWWQRRVLLDRLDTDKNTLDRALAILKEQGLAENPQRGTWRRADPPQNYALRGAG